MGAALYRPPGRSASGSGVAASPDGSVVYVTGITGQQLTGKARAYTMVAYDANPAAPASRLRMSTR